MLARGPAWAVRGGEPLQIWRLPRQQQPGATGRGAQCARSLPLPVTPHPARPAIASRKACPPPFPAPHPPRRLSKADNVLLCTDPGDPYMLRGKVADFGLSR